MHRKRFAGPGLPPRPAERKRGVTLLRPTAADYGNLTAARMAELERRLAALIAVPPARRRAFVLEQVRP